MLDTFSMILFAILLLIGVVAYLKALIHLFMLGVLIIKSLYAIGTRKPVPVSRSDYFHQGLWFLADLAISQAAAWTLFYFLERSNVFPHWIPT